MNEKWKEICEYEGMYEVSSNGNIRSVNRKVFHTSNNSMKTVEGVTLIQEQSNRGYKRVTLSKNGKVEKLSIHRLVAKAFIPNPDNKPHINHIDGDKKNNILSNLEWCTQSENMLHSSKVLGNKAGKPMQGKLGKDSPFSKKVVQLTKDDTFVNSFYGLHEAQRETGVNKANIGEVCNGNRKLAGGFKWKYDESVGKMEE